MKLENCNSATLRQLPRNQPTKYLRKNFCFIPAKQYMDNIAIYSLRKEDQIKMRPEDIHAKGVGTSLKYQQSTVILHFVLPSIQLIEQPFGE